MLEDIEKWVALGTLAIGTVAGYFRLVGRVEKVETKQEDSGEVLEKVREDLDQLQLNESANNATREQMLKMLEENRLDVKKILSQLAVVASRQGKDNEQ